MSYPYIMQGNNICIVIDNIPYNINDTHMGYQDIKNAIKNGDWDKIKSLVDVKQLIADFSKGNVSVYGDTLFWKKEEMHGCIVARFIQMHKEGFPVDSLIAFMDNMMSNSSSSAIKELYDFIEKGNLPITPDGCFLAYKRIKADYTDCYTGVVLNKPAALLTTLDKQMLDEASQEERKVNVCVVNGVTVVSTPRESVDSNRNNTCSYGLHFCSLSYLPHFSGERTIIVKINPKDVVSIPTDYNNSKGRCCRYEIIGEVPNDAQHLSFSEPVQTNATNVYVESTTVPENEMEYDFDDDVRDDDVDDDNSDDVEDSEQAVASVFTTSTPKPSKPLSMTPNAIRKREKRALLRKQSGK